VLNRLVLPVRRRIAVKLTLTLVGFVAVTTLVAGVYLRHALDQFAVEALEARLATAGRLLHDETRGLLRGKAGAEEMARFTRRAAVPTGSRVTVIAPDGLVLGDSDIAPGDLGTPREPQGAAEVRGPRSTAASARSARACPSTRPCSTSPCRSARTAIASSACCALALRCP
jgi:hypothetical protein